MSVVVRGIDSWGQERAEAIDEPQLLEQVRRTLVLRVGSDFTV
jgi:hypothetical protein